MTRVEASGRSLRCVTEYLFSKRGWLPGLAAPIRASLAFAFSRRNRLLASLLSIFLLTFPVISAAADEPRTEPGRNHVFTLNSSARSIMPTLLKDDGAKEAVGRSINLGEGSAARMALSKDGASLYVSNATTGKVDIIDPGTGGNLGSISVGASPHGLATVGDSILYVANTGSQTVSVIDIAQRKKLEDIEVDEKPLNLAVTPDQSKVYVISGDTDATLTEIDTAQRRKTKSFSLRTALNCVVPAGVAAAAQTNPDAAYVYVLCRVSADSNVGSLVQVNTQSPTGDLNSLNGVYVSNSLAMTKDGKALYNAAPTGDPSGTRVQFFDLRDAGNGRINGGQTPPNSGSGLHEAVAVSLSSDDENLYAVNEAGSVFRFALERDAGGFPVPAQKEYWTLPGVDSSSGPSDIAVGEMNGKTNITIIPEPVVSQIVQGDNLRLLPKGEFTPRSGPMPTGVLTLADVGPTGIVTGISTPAFGAGGNIDIPTRDLMPGRHRITASYPGDDNYLGTSTSLQIDVIKKLSLDTGNLPDAIIGRQYEGSDGFSLTVSGGWGGYRWEFQGPQASLPPGLQFTHGVAGLISGTPTLVPATTYPEQYGKMEFLVSDTGEHPRHELEFNRQIRVVEPLEVTSRNVIRLTAGAEVHVPLTTSGGAGKKTWSVPIPGVLPAGLFPPNGENPDAITGKTTATGSPTVYVEVSDETFPAQTERIPLFFTFDKLTVPTKLPDGVQGRPYTGALKVEGGVGDYTWEIPNNDLPAGLKLDAPSGTLTGELKEAKDYTFTVKVTQAATANQKEFSASGQVTLHGVEAPKVVTETLARGVIGKPYDEVTLEASGGTGEYTWSTPSNALPPGLNLSGTGVIFGTPTALGTFSFPVTVKDGNEATETRLLKISIVDALKVTDSSLISVAGKEFTVPLEVEGGTGPYSWSFTAPEDVPSWLRLVGGSLTGKPPAEAAGTTLRVGVTVNDGAGSSPGTGSVAIDIAEPVVLTVQTTSVDSVAGEEFTVPLEVEGGTGPYSWSFTAPEDVPSWLRLVGGSLTGKPPAEARPVDITVAVHDNATPALHGTGTIRVDVHQPGTIFVSTNQLPPATTGALFEQTLTAEGGTARYKWEVTDGALPLGLTLEESTGRIFGTPEKAGEASFTVTATDESDPALSGSAGLGITVTDPPPQPSITTATLAGATTGSSYEQTLKATGGTAPHTWEITKGGLPEGLTLVADRGTITGTPTTAGTTSFTATVTDAVGQTDAHDYTLVTSTPAAGPTTTSNPTANPSAAPAQVDEVPKGAPDTGLGAYRDLWDCPAHGVTEVYSWVGSACW